MVVQTDLEKQNIFMGVLSGTHCSTTNKIVTFIVAVTYLRMLSEFIAELRNFHLPETIIHENVESVH